MQYLFQKFEEFQHCFQLKRFHHLKTLEAEIIELIEKSEFENDEFKLIKKIENDGSGSVKIDYAIWKKQIELGAIKSSKKIFQQVCKKLEKIKNQEFLERLLVEAISYYKKEETARYQLELDISRGENEKVKILLEETSLEFDSIEKINANIEYWASLENNILDSFLKLNNGIWSSDIWFYKQLLKFTFERILRLGKNEQINIFFEKIKVKHKSEDHISLSGDNLNSEAEKIENQIHFLIKIKKFSKALSLLSEVEDTNKRKKLKAKIEKEIEVGNDTQKGKVGNNSEKVEKISKELMVSLSKLERVILVKNNKEELVTYINFCVHSELFNEAIQKICDLEKIVKEENELIDLKLLKAQLQIRDKQYTEALLDLNDLLSDFPLKNNELKLADRLIKKIMMGKDR